MTPLVTAEKPAHYYRQEGGVWMPFYEIESANGKGLRQVTLRDARKVLAVPSVTNVLNILARPWLEAWKATQYIEAALTLPRLDNEPLDAYAQRVVEDAEAKSAVARDFGTRIHKAIEQNLTQPIASLDKDIEPFMDLVQAWMNVNIVEIYAAETIVGNKALGYAGRLDLFCGLKGHGRALIDFKTQGIKNGKPPNFYTDWARQLAAYRHASDYEVNNIVSVVIDSTKPQTPFVQAWPETDRYWMAFQHCLAIWKDEKDYDPSKAS